MTFWGELPQGPEMLLGEPLSVELLYDRDAPADQLTAVFPAEEPWEALSVVRVFHEGKLLFGGIVDEQNATLSESGLQVELVCRSWEALLLDNEAQPAVLRSPSLEALWEKYLKPLGLAGYAGEKGAQTGEMTVEKGMSCWEVLEGFCQDYLGVSPWVDSSGMLHCESLPESRVEAGPVLWAEFSLLPCKQLSTVWQQSYRGTYDTPFRGGASLGIQRQRYVSMEDGRDPRGSSAGGAAGEPSAHCGVPGAVLACPGGAGQRAGRPLGALCRSSGARCPLYPKQPRGTHAAYLGRRGRLMWLTRQGSRSSGARLRRGQVSGTGEQLRIQGESEYHSPELLFPYGYSAAAAEGGRALMLDGVCAGMAAAPDGDLSQGEVRIYSAGGAEILLKNTGEVVINGQSFPPKEL